MSFSTSSSLLHIHKKKTFRNFFSMWNLLWPFLFIHNLHTTWCFRSEKDKCMAEKKNHICESTQQKRGENKVENKYSLSKRLWMFVPTFLINSFFHIKAGACMVFEEKFFWVFRFCDSHFYVLKRDERR